MTDSSINDLQKRLDRLELIARRLTRELSAFATKVSAGAEQADLQQTATRIAKISDALTHDFELDGSSRD